MARGVLEEIPQTLGGADVADAAGLPGGVLFEGLSDGGEVSRGADRGPCHEEIAVFA
jgi:hypothetical protein